MAHKTLINGTSYSVVGGSTLINGSSYRITAGKTLIDGTAYSIPLVSSGGFEWVGWESADWEDINNLCYAKQQGYIDSWPSDVILGGTKSVTLSEAVLNTTTHDVMIIGMDQDGEGTLTFQTKNCLATTTVFGSSAVWIGSTVRTQCQNYYNAFPGKSYIKAVSKGTCLDIDSGRNNTPTYNNETVWVPSEQEMGLDSYSSLSVANSSTSKAECTQGYNAPYSWYASGNRVKKLGDDGSADTYWERSRRYDSSDRVCAVYTNGAATAGGYQIRRGLAPAFVIGNPETATI